MSARVAGKSPAQVFALAFGAVYVAVGILGLFVAGSFTGGSQSDKLILFPVNHLHNIVHLAVGALWLAASRTHPLAKGVNLMIGGVYLVVAIAGFTGAEVMHTLLNIDGAGSADNILHLATAVAALYFGTAGARSQSPAYA